MFSHSMHSIQEVYALDAGSLSRRCQVVTPGSTKSQVLIH